MYCTKCGKQIEDGAKFCEHCGNSVDTETAEVKEMKETKIPPKGMKKIVLGVAAAIVLILVMSLFGGKTINLSKYVTLTVSGYEGYGKAEWDFDEKAFEEKYKNKLKFTRKAKEEFGSYTTPCEVVELLFSGKLDKADGLSNGDLVTFTWNEIEEEELKEVFKNKFKFKNVTLKVDGLEKIDQFDAFADISIEYSGCEPTAYATVNNHSKDAYLQGLYYEVIDGTELSNGDVFTVKVSSPYGDDLADYCAANIGKVPETDTKEYTVEGLNAYITSIDQIPKEFLGKMKTEVEDHLRAESADWVDEVSLEDVTYIGAYVINKKPNAYGMYGDNRVYLIYNVGVHEDYASEGVDNHINYYYYGAFPNVMLLADGTCSADLASMVECDETFRRELDVEYGKNLGLAFWEPTTRLTYHGFEDLDSMFNDLITAKVDDYTYVSTVEDVEAEVVEVE